MTSPENRPSSKSGAWSTGRSKRSTELPPNWPAIRAQVKARAGGRCEGQLHTGQRCPERGTDCHHEDRADHNPDHMQWLCRWHHDQETARQGAQARAAARAKLRFPIETNPGINHTQ